MKLTPLMQQLVTLGISQCDSFVPYYPRVRDRGDIAVFRCQLSGVFVLSRSDHISTTNYESMDDLSYWQETDRTRALARLRKDDVRRARLLEPLLAGRDWLDVGTGLGGVLDLVGLLASTAAAVEPQAAARAILAQHGYKVYSKIAEVRSKSIDLLTAFHSFEHVDDPLLFLQEAARVCKDNSRICLEVPHANDALIRLFDSEPFKRFSFWSEHQILHTRQSLEIYLRAAGFREVSIQGIQRYSLANHLYWLVQGEPGGQNVWPFLSDANLDSAYTDCLARLDMTDTLLAWASFE